MKVDRKNRLVGMLWLIVAFLTPITLYAGAGPNIMVFSDDAAEGAVGNKNRIYDAVVFELTNILGEEGYGVYEEGIVGARTTKMNANRDIREVISIARSFKRPPIDIALVFRTYLDYRVMRYGNELDIRIHGRLRTVQSGEALGAFEVKKTFTDLPMDCDLNCQLEHGAKNAKRLATDLADILSTKLTHVLSGGGSARLVDEYTSDGSSGFAKEYTVMLKGFSPDERGIIEEYMVEKFDGGNGGEIRITDCSRRHCEYWYRTQLSGAHLYRNLQRLVDEVLEVPSNVSVDGNLYEVERIGMKKQRKSTKGDGW